MKKSLSFALTGLVLVSTLPALALPKMEYVSARSALYRRKPTPTGVEFNSRRVRDFPSFDKLGIGNYQAEYRLDDGKKLLIWMYVESAPPQVDEVVLHVSPARREDVTHERALQLIDLVYGESNSGFGVVRDFQEAKSAEIQNAYKLPTRKYEHQSLLPKAYDGGLYYLGTRFGYKVAYNRGGLEVNIYSREYLQTLVMDIKKRAHPDPTPTPTPMPTPKPTPTPRPRLTW